MENTPTSALGEEQTSQAPSETVTSQVVTSNPSIENMVTAFDAIPEGGKLSYITGVVDTGTEAHIQGMGIYNKYSLLTHNRVNGPGFWIVSDPKEKKAKTHDIKDTDNFRHPGGMQVIGDYAVVGIEKSERDNKSAHIRFFNLTKVSDSKGPVELDNLTITRTTGGAACVGIAWVGNRYVVAAYTSMDAHVHIYESNNCRLDNPALTFNQQETYSFQAMANDKAVGYDNLTLQTDDEDNVYLIGLRSEEDKEVFKDYADLLRLDIKAHSAHTVRTRHLKTKTNGEGLVGAHFRYGAYARIPANSDKIVLGCSDRLASPGFEINTFDD